MEVLRDLVKSLYRYILLQNIYYQQNFIRGQVNKVRKRQLLVRASAVYPNVVYFF